MLPPTPKTHDGTRASLGMRGQGATPARRAAIEPKTIAMWLLTALLVYGAFEVFRPLAAPIVLGAWAAHLSRPLFLRLSRAFKGRDKAAGLLTGVLVVLMITPLVVGVTTLVPAARALFEQLRSAQGGRGVLSALVSGGGAPSQKLDVVGLAKQYGAGASKAFGIVASASADVIIGAFVFLATFFALLVEGERTYAWFESRAPLEPSVFRRMSNAFYQAGRGLLVGNGLTALVQGVLAGIIYAALGVPRAVLLGLLSVIGALIPVTGPALVWVPVAAGLALTGHPVKAVILCALGVVVVGTVDNVMRPWLSQRANVGLSTTVVLVAIFGGMAAFGPWGLLLGPLVARLAVEALEIMRDCDLFARRPVRPPSGQAT